MEKPVKILAMYVARQIDLGIVGKTLGLDYPAANNFQFFFGSGDRFQLYTRYGVVVFSAHTEEEARTAIQKVQSAIVEPRSTLLAELAIILQPGIAPHMETGRLMVDRLDDSVLQMAMTALGQSLALEYFHSIAQSLIEESKALSGQMVKEGKLKVGRKEMLKFMGRSMKIQNEFADNIFIFKNVGEQEKDDLQILLRRYFNLTMRATEIEYAQRTIEDNLKTFLQISNQRESNVLEWIIIILITMEILNVFISQLLDR
jgi:uncharacterized Rmd1/YagE family protein